MSRSINAPSLSLSQKLRAESSRASATNSNSSKQHAHSIEVERSSRQVHHRTLPTISQSLPRTSPAFPLPEPFEHLSPTLRRNTINRLAGLSDNVNSSGLFSDNHVPKTISSLCVRCGTLAALCMICSEQDTEDALTFYRKTRAAGAATLFNKAFIEAGFRKTLKFLIFRLLKNSIQAKIRERMKKKMIVEKLFGANLVYLPFSAWRRYTKENIVHRKNKTIEQLSAQIEVLQAQIKNLSTNVNELTSENEILKATIVQKDSFIQQQNEKMEALETDNYHQRQRVKGLSHLVVPLMNYSNALESITQQKIVETNRYLQKGATLATTYNYNHLFEEKLFDNLYHKLHEKKRKETYAPKLTNVNLPSKQLQAGHQILLTWLYSISMQANEYIESTSGQSLNYYLPQHVPVETLSDLRNGKLLCRVIVAIIYDRMTLRQEAEQGIVNINVSYYQLWTKRVLSIEDLEKIQSLQTHTLELVTFLISLTVMHLEMPAFKAVEIFSGKSDVIYNFVMCLMNASIPRVSKAEKEYFEKKISLYYQIVNEIEELNQEKTATLTTTFYENKLDGKVMEAPMVKEKLKSKKLKDSTIEEGNEEEEDESVNKEKAAEEEEEEKRKSQIEESVEIKTKSVLEQLYEFFISESEQRRAEEENQQQSIFASPLRSEQEVEEETNKEEGDFIVNGAAMIVNADLGLDSSFQSKTTDSVKPILPSISIDNVKSRSSDNSGYIAEDVFPSFPDDLVGQVPSPKLPKVQYSLQMSEQSYQQLCKLLDDFIVSPESAQVLEISEKSFIISEKLAELQSAITLIRDHRDEGIRLTTDIRQFVTSESMKLTFVSRNHQE